MFKKIIFSALALVVGFIVFNAVAFPGPHQRSAQDVANDPEVQAQLQAEKREAEARNVKLNKPIFTKRSALVCPLNVLFDEREGYGLKGAVDAHLSIFGHDEAIAKSGCSELVENIPVVLTEEGKQDVAKYQSRGMCGMVESSEGLIFSCSLKN